MNVVHNKTRLVLWLGLVLGAGFLGSSLFGYIAARNTVRNNIITQGLPLTSDTVYSEVQKELLRPIGISAQMAENTFLRDWVTNGETTLEPIKRYLRNIQKRFGTDSSFFISERTRNYYHPNGIAHVVKENDPEDAWYFRVRAMKSTYELNADPDRANRYQMTVFINYRLLDDQGKFLGATGVGITLTTLQGLIHRIEQRFGQRVYFVDKKGNVVLANNTAQTTLQNTPGLASIAGELLNPKNPASSAAYPSGDTQIQVYSRFIPELNWFLLIEQDETQAVAPFARLLWINLAIGLLATLLVLGLAMLTVNKFQNKLEKLATTDTLTRTFNRATGEAILEQVYKDAKRHKHPFCVLLFDIDNFKMVNDSHGHVAGDAVLRGIAGLAAGAVRASDTLVRWGGEEFLLILKHCDLAQAQTIAENVRQHVAKHDFALHRTISISLGVAQHLPNETHSDFINRTDAALYLAKQRGKNRVEVAEAPAASTTQVETNNTKPV